MVSKKLHEVDIPQINNEKKMLNLIDNQGKDIAVDIAALEAQIREILDKTGIQLEGDQIQRESTRLAENERLAELEDRLVNYIDS